ncbi:MAG: tripartite tricarboxylate transporter TctB family protein [Comamonas sp.]
MPIKSQKDFFAGLMFAVVGGGFAIGATNYTVGTGARMGPGYFPLLLGIVLGVMGVIVMLLALRAPHTDKVGKWAWRQIFFVLAGNVLFGIALGGLPSIGLPPMGLILGIYALVIVASKAGDEFHWPSVLILATVLAVGSYLAFIYALKLIMPVWPTFITG